MSQPDGSNKTSIPSRPVQTLTHNKIIIIKNVVALFFVPYSDVVASEDVDEKDGEDGAERQQRSSSLEKEDRIWSQ
jgi:hypothetical protein